MRRRTATATGTATMAPPEPRRTGLTPEQELANWLVTSGKLRELAGLRAKHRQHARECPGRNGTMLIQRFGLPNNVVDAYRLDGSRLLTSQVSWQGGQLALEGACRVLLGERDMEALFNEYCPDLS